MSNITLPKNFDASLITFDSVKQNSMGGKIVYITYNGQKKINMQTPEMNCPFGLSTFHDDKSGTDKYSLDASFKGSDENEKIKIFLDKLSDFDNLLIDTAVKNSKDWLGKKMGKEVVSELYRPMVKLAKDPEKYSPTIKFKIRSGKDEKLQVEAYDSSKNKMDITNLVAGSKVQSIIECASVWFVNKQFGVSWNLVQCKVGKSDKVAGYSFVAEDDDSDDENASQEEGATELDDSAAKLQINNSDSDTD
tara:strand:- start:193 stop:939 length:747 start_codon:yes stop_codon:yes gene_type:complete